MTVDKNSLNFKVAKNIMLLRAKKNLTQVEFASLIDMSKSTYSDKENGKTEITLNELERISKGLEVDFSDLMGTSDVFNQNNKNCIVLTQNKNGTLYFEVDEDVIKSLDLLKSKE